MPHAPVMSTLHAKGWCGVRRRRDPPSVSTPTDAGTMISPVREVDALLPSAGPMSQATVRGWGTSLRGAPARALHRARLTPGRLRLVSVVLVLAILGLWVLSGRTLQ